MPAPVNRASSRLLASSMRAASAEYFDSVVTAGALS